MIGTYLERHEKSEREEFEFKGENRLLQSGKKQANKQRQARQIHVHGRTQVLRVSLKVYFLT